MRYHWQKNEICWCGRGKIQDKLKSDIENLIQRKQVLINQITNLQANAQVSILNDINPNLQIKKFLTLFLQGISLLFLKIFCSVYLFAYLFIFGTEVS